MNIRWPLEQSIVNLSLTVYSAVMKNVVIIDNYDSFTYNLKQAVAVHPHVQAVTVLRNDAVGPEELQRYEPTHLIFSPGPGRPTDAGRSLELIAAWAGRVPILGVCLGHQCIGQAFGARIVRAPRCMHGKTSMIYHDGQGVLARLPNPFCAMRYHSLIVDTAGLDPEFVVSAWTDQHEVMAIRNGRLRIEGVQFHPESFATPQGQLLLSTFLE